MRTSSFIRCFRLILLAFSLETTSAHAVCPKPDPRVCAEFFKSDLVFVGTVTREQTISADKQTIDEWKYTLHVKSIYRGTAGPFVTLVTENDNGRYPLKVGETYLLFAFISEGRLTIEGCGNNIEFSKAQQEIREIKEVLEGMKSARGGTISGVVHLDYGGLSMAPGVVVTASRAGKTYSAVTNRDGYFQIEVPAGGYVVNAKGKDREFIQYELSYDDPRWVIVHRGGCAQVMFVVPEVR